METVEEDSALIKKPTEQCKPKSLCFALAMLHCPHCSMTRLYDIKPIPYEVLCSYCRKSFIAPIIAQEEFDSVTDSDCERTNT